MDTERFDTERFIDEIEKRPALWNIESSEYKNREKKRKCWQEMVELFSEDGETSEKKIFVGSQLQKKWKNIRDSFCKEFKKQKNFKSGSAASNIHPYIYFNRLRFLENSLNNKETVSNLDTDSTESAATDIENHLTEEVSRSGVFTAPKNKKIKMNPVDKHFSDILLRSVAIREKREEELNNQDDDKLFCMSLFKELKKVPDHARMRIKIQLMEVLERAQDFFNQPLNHSSIIHPTHHSSIPNYSPIIHPTHHSSYSGSPNQNPNYLHSQGYTTFPSNFPKSSRDYTPIQSSLITTDELTSTNPIAPFVATTLPSPADSFISNQSSEIDLYD